MSKELAKTKCSHAIFRSNSFGNVPSRYLREPTVSCHNLCKYGGKHEPERAENRLTFRRFMANRIASETVENLVKGPTAMDKTKKKVIKMKPSDTSKDLELNIQPNKVGKSDNSVNTNVLSPLSKHQRAISSAIPDHSSVSLKARKSRRHAILKKSGKTINDNGDFNQKILKVVEPKKDGKGLEPQEKLSKVLDGHASNSAFGKANEYSNGQNLGKFKRIASKEEDKRRARRTPAVQQPDDSSSSPYKLKFKRGKVIELRTADSVGPRRLKFRRGRVLDENPSGEVAKRSFRRRREIGDSNEHNSEAHAVMLKKANLESKVGMFKYQDAQGRKEFRALFNHVIEETANKLVETRKSKVKALVGAFETVISLQEAKPPSLV